MIHQARDAGRLDLPHHGQHVRLEGVGCLPVRRLPGPLRVRQVGRVRVAELPAYGRHAERTALLETLGGPTRTSRSPRRNLASLGPRYTGCCAATLSI